MKPLSRTLAVLGAGAVIASSVIAADVRPASAAALTPDQIKSRAIADAKAQIDTQDYTTPASKPRWKVLFLGFADVNFADARVRDVMNADDREYVKTVANNFEQVIEEIADVDIVPTVKIDNDPLVVHQGSSTMLHEWSIGDRLKRVAGVAEYDAITTFTRGNNGGVAFPGYYNDETTRGSAYFYNSLMPFEDEATLYPKQTHKVQYTTEVSLHEFSHVFEQSRLGYERYPDVHQSGSYGYNHPTPFYLDMLSAKVPIGGKKYGTFPKMWSTSPRFLHNPAMVKVNYQDQYGQTIAPSTNTYGPAGDPYSIRGPEIGGVKSSGVKSGSAPANGTFSASSQPEVTLVYQVPTTVSFSNGSTADANDTAARKSGERSYHYYEYRSNAPISRYTYTQQLASNDGAAWILMYLGVPITFDANNTATVTKDGNTYTLVNSGGTVTITVQVGTPKQWFTVHSLTYVNWNDRPWAAAQEVLTLRSVTPTIGGPVDMVGKAPRATINLSWATNVTFSNGRGTDANDTAPVRKSDEYSNHYYEYRSNVPVTQFTYTDDLASNNGAVRMLIFLGSTFSWDGNGTATISKDGNTYKLVRNSATKVTITVTLGTPSEVFRLQSMNYANGNQATPASAQEVLTLVNVTPHGQVLQAMTGKAPRAVVNLAWNAR